jgi:hypothetical protein
MPPKTRQSGPEGKDVPKAGTLHDLKPGGPIMPKKQGFVNPGPTDNLRGVEPNTAMHRGTPNPHQMGSAGHIGGADHNPGMEQATNTHGHETANTPMQAKGRTSEHSKKMAPPMPNPKGVRK